MPADTKNGVHVAETQKWPGRRPDTDLMQQMMQASRAPDRKGEAVLRILTMIGSAGPGDLAPDISIEMVHALQEMGTPSAAKALAADAVLLYRPAAQ